MEQPLIRAFTLACLLSISAAKTRAAEWDAIFHKKSEEKTNTPKAKATPEPTAVPDWVPTLPHETVNPHLKGKPIPSAADAPTDLTFSKANHAWLVHNWLEPYQRGAHPDPAVADFISKAMNYMAPTSLNRPTQTELAALLTAGLVTAGGDDSAFNFFAALAYGDLTLQRHYFEQAAAGLPQGNYPKFVAYMVFANLGKAVHDTHGDAELQKTSDDKSLAALRDSLAGASFTSAEMSVLRWRLGAALSSQDLFDRHAPEFCEILDKSPHVDHWVADYFEGLRAIDEAWHARGGGFSGTVTQDGWKGFEQKIAVARHFLEQSWKANPHDPAAATAMVKVAMAESEEHEPMRLWFDRSLAAQIDYGPAFDALFWGLRPRWLGNYAEMIQIGRESAATQRYDTLLPFQYLYALRSIATDSEDMETIYKNPELNQMALSVLDGYLAAPNSYLNPQYAHTYAAIIAYKGNQLDLAKKHLAAIDWTPVANPDLNKLENLIGLVEKLRQ